jgi:multiple sugar transport system substrate-binding protein
LLAPVAVALAVGALTAGCGSSSSSGGAVTLNWFIANQPGGSIQEVAKRCSDESNGRYTIDVQLLPAAASDQREQLVRRLAARDSTVDLIGMDVIWTAEFANAGWVKPYTPAVAKQVTKHVFPSVIKTASFKSRLYGAPFNSNTQLLWYRKDLVKKAPTTWGQTIGEAKKLATEGKPHTVLVQGNKYEGFTVWVNALIQSAGGHILSGPTTVDLKRGPTEKALEVMGGLGNSPAAAPDIDTAQEGSPGGSVEWETGSAAFMVNYPFVYASAKADNPAVFKNMGFARYPRVVPSMPSKPPLGGFNIGVGAYTSHPDQAFEAAKCISDNKSELTATKLDGLPPSRSNLYKNKVVTTAYPGFAGLVKRSIESAGPRPLSPAYQDVSLAIQDTLHPASSIDPNDVGSTYDTLKGNLDDAVQRKGLF